ncbi:chromosomal replication initiator protein DnaA [Fructilactobacillus fructivorans]|uniref:Chromosomal replication initiator protein DnaA n=1 Tax=Fructilactobacillus fructivorans TaxID=1614 RepID=A0A0C1M7L2_9LACO|nr:chromosomal replication initiator protein DnaA [Fructilactobacillus fructivorans]KID42449.1 Chromosomal replication initiator protein DnaA [Fructilactobacillus fructivorans]KRK58053.1 chromosomal replication initiation protein [Fructilactobacillus fructivorans]KRN41282.1 chromosomal replication initiation protein [Fructilactobacillus fructivorans]KRN43097.1 chromosomal replication initiation protein [Fructilactobacillus fructivorans]MCT0150939.1 chromosomal replication initiator protein Dna
MDQNELWDKIKNKFKADPKFEGTTYDTWIATVKPIAYDGDTLTLELPSSLHRDYWEKMLKSQLVEYAYSITYKNISPKFVLEEELQKESKPAAKPADGGQDSYSYTDTHLEPNYTFETFVIGQGNKMAQAAALAVSESPGKLYNPLFLYGGVGLGKTHLMHAIGNNIVKHDPSQRVMYVTSEKFANDFIGAIQNNKMDEFRHVYRNVDVLLVDDIQFFGNKEGTQDEFFNTFQALYSNHKQIVLTSDRLPNEVPKLKDRLVSRFAWGLSVDITAPDLETRTAILRAKAKADNMDIPADALGYIASQIESNVRELEGALSRVQAYAKLNNAPIDTELVANALRPLKLAKARSALTVSDIISKVASYYHISVKEIKGTKRVKAIVVPRQIAMYLSREMTDNSLPKIGDEFGGKDHTTVIHAYDKISRASANDSDLSKQISDIKTELQH